MANLPDGIKIELENIAQTTQAIILLLNKNKLSKHEVNSAAFMLMNFYNGIENIIKQLFKIFNIKINNSADWHKDILIKAGNEKLFSKKLLEKLMEYLRFRHFAIHNYTFNLQLELFIHLLNDLERTYKNFEKALLKLFR